MEFLFLYARTLSNIKIQQDALCFAEIFLYFICACAGEDKSGFSFFSERAIQSFLKISYNQIK